MPFNFKTCQYYELDIKGLLSNFHIPKKHKVKIINNFFLLDEMDNVNKTLPISYSKVKQVMDMETIMHKHYFNLTFNVDKILKLNNNNFKLTNISLKYLIPIIPDESNFQNKLRSNKPVLLFARPFTHYSSKKLKYMCSIIDGNHRVYYYELNNLKSIESILIDYNFLILFNPFNSLSEWFLSILFEEIYQYQNKNFIQKLFYPFSISTSNNILDEIPLN